MEKLFYSYSIIYISYILYNFIIFCQKGEKEPLDDEIMVNPVGTLKKIIKPDFIIYILNSIWIFVGFFTGEKMWFLLLAITSNLLSVISLNKKNKELSVLFVLNSFLKTIIIICIIYIHFLKP